MQCLAIYASLRIYQSKAKSKYILYALANITLFSRIIYFGDVFKGQDGYSGGVYLFFASLSIFTYLMTGLSYLLFVILELLYQFESLHVMNRNKDKQKNCRNFLKFFIIALPFIFLINFILQRVL